MSPEAILLQRLGDLEQVDCDAIALYMRHGVIGHVPPHDLSRNDDAIQRDTTPIGGIIAATSASEVLRSDCRMMSNCLHRSTNCLRAKADHHTRRCTLRKSSNDGKVWVDWPPNARQLRDQILAIVQDCIVLVPPPTPATRLMDSTPSIPGCTR